MGAVMLGQPVKRILFIMLAMWYVLESETSAAPNVIDLQPDEFRNVNKHAVTTVASNKTMTVTPGRKNCFDGKAFKSLLSCREACEDLQGNGTESSVPNITSLFKLLVLKKSEFEILCDGMLQTTLSNKPIPTTYYSKAKNNTTAYVCYQMTTEFNQCDKWSVYDNEFEYIYSSRTLLVQKHGTYEIGNFFMNRNMKQARVCIVEAKETIIRHLVQLSTVSISAVALLITLILALCVPALDIKRNTVLMCHMFMLCAAYTIMVVKLVAAENGSHAVCITLSVLQQYLFLSAFFWINVQAFDLCRTLTSLRWRPGSPINSKRKSWIVYSCYAWIVPLLISGVTLTVELTLSEDSKFFPALRHYCWFRNDQFVPLIYFYCPIAFVLLTNFVMFVITVSSLFRVGKGVVSANKRIHQQLFRLYMKLVLVMGLCWILEVASWAEGDNTYWWAITDTINCLQGLFIFIIYICKTSHIKAIVKHCRRPIKWSLQTATGKASAKTGTTSSSNTDNSNPTSSDTRKNFSETCYM